MKREEARKKKKSLELEKTLEGCQEKHNRMREQMGRPAEVIYKWMDIYIREV